MGKTFDELEAELRGVARGERSPSPGPERRVPDPVDVLTPSNRELLRVIAEREPAGIGELADLLGKQRTNVSRSLRDLYRLGLVRLVREGSSIRPVLAAAEVRVDLRAGASTVVPLPAAE